MRSNIWSRPSQRRNGMSQFNIPAPPDMVFPQTPQTAAEIVLWTVVAGSVVYAIREWRRTGSPLALVLLAGGGIALLNEPLDDIQGSVLRSGAIASCVIGLAILDGLARWMYSHTPSMADASTFGGCVGLMQLTRHDLS
jgi:hypothetical protein